MRRTTCEPEAKVQVVNVENGARLETYVIEGARGGGTLHAKPRLRAVAASDGEPDAR